MYLTMKFFLKLTGLRVFLFIVPGLFVFFISSGKCVLSNNKSDVILARQLVDQSGIRGGLVVHLGSDDGLLTSELYVNESFVVHALNRDHALVEQSRNRLHDLGLYGPISVDHWSGERLPYADNLVNLIVVEDTGEIKMEEILRVLAPLGVALVKQFGEWTKTVKPWPEEIDEWTHYLYGPDNNAVSDDLIVGPPRRLQWVSPPRWSRIHDHLANLSAAVNAGGRLFYIMDKGPTADIAMPAEWTLISRDAFNGIHLWEKPMGEWEFRFRPFRTGPPDLTRRLVASGDLLYVTLGYGEPVVALDGATGENMHVYDQTVNSQEIIFYDGVLYLVIGEEPPDIKTQQLLHAEFDRSLGFHPSPYIEKRPRTQLMAVDAVTGKTLWHKKGAEVENIMPTTLAVADGYVFFQNTQHVICLETNGGSEIWRSDRPVSRHRRSWSAPTLVVYEGVVFSADRKVPDDQGEGDVLNVQWEVTARSDDVQEGEIIAFSADTGHRLWSAPSIRN